MKHPANLHFLLALGNTKVVVLKEDDSLHFYGKFPSERHKRGNVAPERLAEALITR